ncbi:hypothetical protein J1N35_000665 [Gossypium stocksii]|uniref:Uncharacterized protein n=1 Tax=Gossypium stocksii TaxID=47602 RepID=A0A9D4AKB4_9ROSI|nr:hypothetical protein J1N35_000665 [Gossypium stocksii]
MYPPSSPVSYNPSQRSPISVGAVGSSPTYHAFNNWFVESSANSWAIYEVFDDEFLGNRPTTVPNEVDIDRRRGKDGTHVVTEVDNVRQAFKHFRRGKDSG